MTDIQHELQSLARRQAELEDVELEIMESLEQMNSTLRDAEQAMDQARRDAQEAAAAWDRREDEIASETVARWNNTVPTSSRCCPPTWSRCMKKIVRAADSERASAARAMRFMPVGTQLIGPGPGAFCARR